MSLLFCKEANKYYQGGLLLWADGLAEGHAALVCARVPFFGILALVLNQQDRNTRPQLEPQITRSEKCKIN